METPKKKLGALTIGAIGIVFGDIGTSPLYALREAFSPQYGIAINQANVYGILSLMFWAIMALVTVKYLLFMMRADNKGEGGILALTALAQRCFRRSSRGRWLVTALGIFGASMFYGDGMITPAISVLSAVEGLEIATPAFQKLVMPISIVILVFNNREMGQPALAALAAFSNSIGSAPGILAIVCRWMEVMVGPVSSISKVKVAVVLMLSGFKFVFPSSAESAINWPAGADLST